VPTPSAEEAFLVKNPVVRSTQEVMHGRCLWRAATSQPAGKPITTVRDQCSLYR
jgi:hypothetical protein